MTVRILTNAARLRIVPWSIRRRLAFWRIHAAIPSVCAVKPRVCIANGRFFSYKCPCPLLMAFVGVNFWRVCTVVRYFFFGGLQYPCRGVSCSWPGEAFHVDSEVTFPYFFQVSLVCVSFLIVLCAGIIHYTSLLQYVYEAGEGDVKLSDLTRGSLGVKLRLRQRLAA